MLYPGLGVSRDPWRPPCSSPARPRRFLSQDLLRGTRPHPAVASTCRRRFSHCCIVRPAPCAPTMQVAHMVSAMPPAAIAASLASERLFVMVLDASKPENVATHRRRGTRPLHGTLSGIHMNWLRTRAQAAPRGERVPPHALFSKSTVPSCSIRAVARRPDRNGRRARVEHLLVSTAPLRRRLQPTLPARRVTRTGPAAGWRGSG